ncbi:hypothetical protein G6F63_015276 [Rhizopus arrhizus]|nr:hypothetical protein G6F63_015276 [Rhizopus arrhizus]
MVRLTPRALPLDWLGDVRGRRILCLASGGGQQAPVLAAAGADVTVFDLSDGQLEQDRRHARSARLRQRQFRCGVPADLEPVRARRAPGVERVPSRARARRHADGQLLQPGAVRRRT